MGNEKIRKVNLSGLPKNIRAGKEIIDWKNSVGCKVPFVYDDIEGDIEIVGYENEKVFVKYLDYEIRKIGISNIKRGDIVKIIKNFTKNFKYEKGCLINDYKRSLLITDQKMIKIKNYDNAYLKWYKYTCNKCGWTEGWAVESSLDKGNNCACCTGQVVVPHINSIKAKAPWMIGLGISEEDAIKYTPCSGKKITVVCPDCKREKHQLYTMFTIENQ